MSKYARLCKFSRGEAIRVSTEGRTVVKMSATPLGAENRLSSYIVLSATAGTTVTSDCACTHGTPEPDTATEIARAFHTFMRASSKAAHHCTVRHRPRATRRRYCVPACPP